MRIYTWICGKERVKEKFAFLPVYIDHEWRWLEKVAIHQSWNGWRWINDWFED